MTLLAPDAALKAFVKIEGVLEKHFGEGIFAFDHDFPRSSCGLFVVDHILGGGLVPGFILEIFGPESTGKTTFAAQTAAHMQALEGRRWLYLDFEHTVSRKYFVNLGVNVDKPHFFLSQPTTLEAGALIARTMMDAGLINGLIWDTPAASQPAAIVNSPLSEKQMREGYRDIEKGKSDVGQIGIHARTFSHALAAMVPLIAKTGTIAIFPNQIRTTINTWGAGETTPGGRALKFHAAVRIRLSKVETTKDSVDDDFFGTKKQTAVENIVQFHTIKNKTTDPFRVAEVRLKYGSGFLDLETTFDLAVKRKVIEIGRTGQFTLHDGTTGRGTQLALDHYIQHPDKFTELKEKLRTTPIGDDEYQEVPSGVDIDDTGDESITTAERPDSDDTRVATLAESGDEDETTPLPTEEGAVTF